MLICLESTTLVAQHKRIETKRPTLHEGKKTCNSHAAIKAHKSSAKSSINKVRVNPAWQVGEIT